MKYTIKNPLNSPYSVAGEKGQVHVPARGEVTDDFSDMQIQAVRAVGYFEVSEGAAKRDPLDHDGDDKEDKELKRGPGRPPKNKE